MCGMTLVLVLAVALGVETSSYAVDTVGSLFVLLGGSSVWSESCDELRYRSVVLWSYAGCGFGTGTGERDAMFSPVCGGPRSEARMFVALSLCFQAKLLCSRESNEFSILKRVAES